MKIEEVLMNKLVFYYIALPDQAMPMTNECSFDRDTCGWRSISNATVLRPDIDWRLASLSRRPANLPDHTFGAPSNDKSSSVPN